MKNARKYERKIRKLLAVSSEGQGGDHEPAGDPVRAMVEGILQADAERRQAAKALDALEADYVDLNEVRVAQPKEIVETLGKEHPRARAKAEMVRRALQGLFERAGTLDMQYMAEMPKRDLRRHLTELGLDRYAAAYVVLTAFDGHAVCVDDTLVGCLEMDGYVEPGSDLADVQGFLERVVLQKDARGVHRTLREYVERRRQALVKKRRAEARRKAEAARREKAKAEEAKKAKKAKRAKKTKKAKKAKRAAKKKPQAAKKAARARSARRRSPAASKKAGRKSAGRARPRKAGMRKK